MEILHKVRATAAEGFDGASCGGMVLVLDKAKRGGRRRDFLWQISFLNFQGRHLIFKVQIRGQFLQWGKISDEFWQKLDKKRSVEFFQPSSS